ncbi:hypothetical protein BOX24_06225 [Leptospirillum ferriphilum]|uniref:Uncharacterized protein n=2 Tax=Leptospirillum ferriphilum TaxID=178606 RepID=A0A1V3SVW7_9BACT|nr:hypothetical protein LFML04_0624 [Leptospirillum ferriphilum ML-04]OOH72969.1 hypothetical protein BOX24_06225 [Leptospirillum ferriphilum]
MTNPEKCLQNWQVFSLPTSGTRTTLLDPGGEGRGIQYKGKRISLPPHPMHPGLWWKEGERP